MGVISGVKTNPILSEILTGLASCFWFTQRAFGQSLYLRIYNEETNRMNKLIYIQASHDCNISVDEIEKYQTFIQSMEVKLYDIEADMMAV